MRSIHELSGAFAVDALDPVDQARYEFHLAECGDCRTEVGRLQYALSSVASELAVEPPASLREAVLTVPPRATAPVPPRQPTAEAREKRRWWQRG